MFDVAAAAQKGNSKALLAAYDGRLWGQGLRNGVQYCWGVQHCEREQGEALWGGVSLAVD